VTTNIDRVTPNYHIPHAPHLGKTVKKGESNKMSEGKKGYKLSPKPHYIAFGIPVAILMGMFGESGHISI
jgi:hypothetical protein